MADRNPITVRELNKHTSRTKRSTSASAPTSDARVVVLEPATRLGMDSNRHLRHRPWQRSPLVQIAALAALAALSGSCAIVSAISSSSALWIVLAGLSIACTVGAIAVTARSVVRQRLIGEIRARQRATAELMRAEACNRLLRLSLCALDSRRVGRGASRQSLAELLDVGRGAFADRYGQVGLIWAVERAGRFNVMQQSGRVGAAKMAIAPGKSCAADRPFAEVVRTVAEDGDFRVATVDGGSGHVHWIAIVTDAEIGSASDQLVHDIFSAFELLLTDANRSLMSA